MTLSSKFMLGLALSLSASSASAIGWPADYEGVMLQGFYWDSYSDTRWTNLTSQAGELSAYFDLIWVPNSAYAGGGNNMGYMPIYWFTNHNSSFGTSLQLRSMIEEFNKRGTGFIADVVVNHRNGATNWYDFPAETWNGVTYKIGLEGICSNDEMAYTTGQPKPTGARDTGDNFDGARDLDHTNANVQLCVKNYCKFLLDDLGYVGFRLDMVKGYSGSYTKIYNQYAQPRFSVGEYWDGNYDAVAAWIEATGSESAAFDFPCKYAINSAFSSNNMTKLVWNANYVTPQPAGLIHYKYPQLAVTFIDNHDTYDDGSKFTGNVVAANAFILFSPGTPCIFLPHWKAYKDELKKLIAIRKSAGIANTSAVTVLKSTTNCYMAEITGRVGKVVVRIGSATDTPAGYTSADIKASGTGYCVWTKVDVNFDRENGSDNPDIPIEVPEKLYLMGNLPQGSWKTNVGIPMERSGNTYCASYVTIADSGEGKNLGFFSFVTALGTSGASTEWDAVINNGDRYGAESKDLKVSVGSPVKVERFYAGVNASSAYSWAITPGTYDFVVDFETNTLTIYGAGQGVSDVTVDADAPVEYFNLQGVPVAEPTPGNIYIRRQGFNTSKVKL